MWRLYLAAAVAAACSPRCATALMHNDPVPAALTALSAECSSLSAPHLLADDSCYFAPAAASAPWADAWAECSAALDGARLAHVHSAETMLALRAAQVLAANDSYYVGLRKVAAGDEPLWMTAASEPSTVPLNTHAFVVTDSVPAADGVGSLTPAKGPLIEIKAGDTALVFLCQKALPPFMSRYQRHLADKTITASPLFTSTVTPIAQCAFECLARPQCVALTYNEGSSACAGYSEHSAELAALGAIVEHVGTAVYFKYEKSAPGCAPHDATAENFTLTGVSAPNSANDLLFIEGTLLRFECNQYYAVNGNVKGAKQCTNGSWSGDGCLYTADDFHCTKGLSLDSGIPSVVQKQLAGTGSHVDCAHHCHIDSDCFAASYNAGDKACRLSDTFDYVEDASSILCTKKPYYPGKPPLTKHTLHLFGGEPTGSPQYQQYNVLTGTGSLQPNTDIPLRAAYEAVRIGCCKVYMLGGWVHGESGCTTVVHVYNLVTGRLSEDEPLRLGLYGAPTLAHEHLIYVCGGRHWQSNNNNENGTCFVYEPGGGVRSEDYVRHFGGPTAPVTWRLGAAVSFAGHLYYMGGYASSVDTTDVLRTDAAMRSWQRMDPLPVSDQRGGALAIGDWLLYCGGHRIGVGTQTWCARYSPSAGGGWERLASRPDRREKFRMSLVDGAVYVTGGNAHWGDTTGTSVTVMRYDWAAGVWTASGHLAGGTALHGLVNV